MAEIKGRLWPADLPFSGDIIKAESGAPYVRDGFECDARAGDFAFWDFNCKGTRNHEAVDSLAFRCPRTGKYCGDISVGHKIKPPIWPSWKWDGNFEAPTLEPSINCISGCGWHGWLRSGVFSEA